MNEFVIIDLETTGLDAEKDQIIDVAAVKVKRGLIVDQYTTLIDCDKPINDFISDLTGITDDMLVNQPHIEDIIDSLTDFIGDAVICAHNAQFDSAFLHKHWNDQREWLDTITLAQIVYPCAASYSLSWLTSMLDIVNSGAHRALADALATAELLIRLKNGLKLLPEKARRDLLTLAADNNAPIDELLRRECALPSGVAEPAVVQPRWNVSNSVEKKETDEFYRIKPEDIERYLAADGEYASRLAGFEERPQQLSMAKEVAEAFNHQSFLLAEAGTGTGKSLAYLLPAALFAAGSGKKVAISTHTKNLQEQLLNKDIPMLGKLINRPLTAAVLKGRSNYLCRRLYQYLLKQPPENLRYFLMRVAVWQAGSISGDGDELSLTGYEQWRWQRVCASKENCTVFCPYFKNGGCYVQKSRTVANNCDIYILNHSLLVANAAMENSFLPPFSHLVIDEAHHLEKAAEEQLASEVDFYALLNLLGRLKRREKGKETGVLMSLRHYTGGMFAGGLCQEVLNRQLDDLERVITNNLSAGEDFFGLLQQFFKGDAAKESYYPAMIRVVERHYH
ncbi:MAG: exonuclease domain-containing protein, partial [Clostridiales bacterium]